MKRSSTSIWLGMIAATLLAIAAPASASAAFGLLPGGEGFSVSAREEGGAVDHQAGSHPYRLTTTVNLNLAPESPGEPGVPFSDGDLRELRLDLPPGLIENPSAIPQCSLTQFHTPRTSPFEVSLSGESCPDGTQVGVVTITTSHAGGPRTFGLFNLVPPPGAPSEIGFNPYGSPIVFVPEIHQAGGKYQLSLRAQNIPQQVNVSGLRISVWGTPWAASHNFERGNCLNEADPASAWENGCSTGSPQVSPPQAYLTLPSDCSDPLVYGIAATSWQQPGTVVRRQFTHFDEGEPVSLEGCGAIGFAPVPRAVVANPRASSPSGFDFELDVGSEGLLRPKRLNSATVRRAVVTLPEGMTINPSVGSGLLGCTPAQYSAETVSSAPGAGCPNGSKIGDFTVQSPLFEKTVEGSIFLAAPFDNPFGTLIGIYLVAKAPERGVLVKVAGKLDADPGSGSLVASFEGLPQLPYTNLKIHFREGQRSPLATPSTCGGYETGIELTPWSGAGSTLDVSSSTPITAGPDGGACPQGTPGFRPQAVAGSVNSQAGAFTPFYIHLTRSDTEQEITSYSTVLPPGLTGEIAGIPYCSDAAIEAARHRGGFEEAEHPSCPADTEIGHTVSGYGVGPALDFASGGLYLAGPFHGSTFSVVAIDSATVGPFDLGTVVVRSAIDVDPQSAQVSIDAAGSDPIPHIIDGIPIHLRDIRVYISRSHFTVNPTSCDPFKVESRLTGSGTDFASAADDTTAVANSPYQAFGCASLPFRPRLKLRLRGGTRRGSFPSLRAELRPRSGDANVSLAKVTLPASEFLEQGHIKTICTLPQFARETCPAASVYGSAQAFSPLLAQPLQGPVYLRSAPDRTLPDLVADLHGGGLGLRIEVVGHIDSVHGGLRGTFETVPDAPVSRFVMNLRGGKRGLLVNSENLCAGAKFANALFIGHNNRGVRMRPKVEAKCKKHRRGGKKRKAARR
ncbi:MAG TPA: hypothetical protein VFK14_12705 [Solirubrobacterales bacterium]|nr:hypothetical protein [Solirubrobacterales bacterium]